MSFILQILSNFTDDELEMLDEEKFIASLFTSHPLISYTND